jgi:hypothetical protein
VSIREFFLENFAGDLEYHPRRALIYLGLAVASACYWIFSDHDAKFAATPLIFVLGSLTLATKGIFLFRKSSEDLGLSQQQITHSPAKLAVKTFDTLPAQASQMLQDFGTGSFLLWPLLNMSKDVDPSWADPPRFTVFVSGAVLFFLGWIVRRFTATTPR